MKNSILILAAIFSISLFTFSCQKEDVTSKEENTEHFFKCKMDGQDYVIKGSVLAYGVKWDTDYAVYGVSNLNADQAMYVNISDDLGVGTHQLDDLDTYALVSLADGSAWSTYWGDGSGTVTITEKTVTGVRGTFSFTVYNADDINEKMEITEGSFNVAFRE